MTWDVVHAESTYKRTFFCFYDNIVNHILIVIYLFISKGYSVAKGVKAL